MKLKSKLVLAASSLLVLSGVAAGTGTYAWFTANQSVDANINNIGVESHGNGLTIAAASSDATNLVGDDTNSTTYNKIFTSSASLTDVSSDGINFYKASLDANGNITGAALRTPATGVTAPLYYEVKVTFTRTNISEPMAIYVSKSTSIVSQNDSIAADHKDLANAARIAILNSAKSSVLAYMAPNDTITTDYKYVSATASPFTTALDVPASTNAYYDNTYTTDVSDYTLNSATKAASRAGMGDGWLLNLTGAIASADVYVRIWLEGTDSDCDNSAIGTGVAGDVTQKIKSQLIFNGLTNFKIGE